MKVHELKKALIDLYTKIQDSQMAVFLVFKQKISNSTYS